MTDDEALEAMDALCATVPVQLAARIETLVSVKHREWLAEREMEFISAHGRNRGCATVGFRSGSWVFAYETAMSILRENGELP